MSTRRSLAYPSCVDMPGSPQLPSAPDRAVTSIDLRAWLVELATVAPDLLTQLGPLVPIRPATRVHLARRVLRGDDAPIALWATAGWREWVGHPLPGPATDAFEAFASSSAGAPQPVDATVLAVRAGEPATRAVRGVVAGARLLGRAEGVARRWVSQGHPGRDPRELVLVSGAAPWFGALVMLGALGRGLVALCPAMPEVQISPESESSLAAHVLAEAVPEVLGHAGWRAALLRSPVVVAIAVRVGNGTATIEIGRGRVRVSDGVGAEALVFIDGPPDSLLGAAVASLTRRIPTTAGPVEGGDRD